ncbi:MAG: tripartite tricarboxylate transporter TctB family protein [Betaproteobacteria bacterium]
MTWSGRFAVSMRRGETATAAVLLLFACAILWGAALMPSGTVGAPGPGFFPRALGALLALVSVALLVRAHRLDGAADEVVALGHPHIALTLVTLVGLALVFEYAGYVPSATLFMLVLLRAFSTLGWTRSMLAAMATAFVSYYLFVHLLSVMLPAGLLQFY